MLRRFFILATLSASTVWLSACSPTIPSKISVTQAQLEQGLQQRFPKNYPVAGLLQLQMQQPQLQLQPQSNQLQAQLTVALSGPALSQTYTGQMDLRFALRYEPRDHTVRAHRVEVLSLTLEGLNPAVSDMVSTYGPRLANQALDEFSLYTIAPENLKLADELQLELGAITVTPQGLDVAVQPKAGTAKP